MGPIMHKMIFHFCYFIQNLFYFRDKNQRFPDPGVHENYFKCLHLNIILLGSCCLKTITSKFDLQLFSIIGAP